MRTIAKEGTGIVIYERQEGRGISLMAKLQAYELQDQGLDTVDAAAAQESQAQALLLELQLEYAQARDELSEAIGQRP